MEKLVIGTIVKAQGIKGEVKVASLTDDDKRFKSLKKVFIADKEFEVVDAKVLHNGVFLQLAGVTDRNTAEELRGKSIEINRISAVKLSAERNFIVDLIGCDIVLDGKVLGKVVEILQNGAADVYVVEGEKKFMFPSIKEVFLEIDTSAKKIVLDKKRFMEVAVYED